MESVLIWFDALHRPTDMDILTSDSSYINVSYIYIYVHMYVYRYKYTDKIDMDKIYRYIKI